MSTVKLSVDPLKCQGHGRCYEAFPEIFEPDEQGFAQVKIDICEEGTSPAADFRAAAAGCPERAISEEVRCD
jgi:ferredoxin